MACLFFCRFVVLSHSVEKAIDNEPAEIGGEALGSVTIYRTSIYFKALTRGAVALNKKRKNSKQHDISKKMCYNEANGKNLLGGTKMANKILYSKEGEVLSVYLPSPYSDKITRYEFLRLVNPNTNYDCWRIYRIEICDRELNALYTNQPGETECEGALRERLADGSVASDFIGGYHGDEYMTKLTVMVDGQELDLSKDYPVTECELVKAVVESVLFRVDSDEKVFDRVKTDTWTADGVEIKNKFTTLAKIKIERPATSMIAVCPTVGERQGLVTEHWDNVSGQWMEICDFDHHMNKCNATGLIEARMRGLLDVHLKTTEYKINGVPTEPYGHFSYQAYKVKKVKIYVDPFTDRTLDVGDVFESTSFQAIFARE